MMTELKWQTVQEMLHQLYTENPDMRDKDVIKLLLEELNPIVHEMLNAGMHDEEIVKEIYERVMNLRIKRKRVPY
jgi:hypothetical protein